jgi:predicted GH43/DUF377 family glycosyl hydrolase
MAHNVLAGRRLVHRLSDRPIAGPGHVPGHSAVFNAGLLRHQGQFHLFARAVRSGYRRGTGVERFVDYVSDVVVLTSDDGLSYRFAYVLAPAGTDGAVCFEDPRVQRVANKDGSTVVMTYTYLPPRGEPWRIGAHELDWHDGRFWLRGRCHVLGPDGVADKDGVVMSLAHGETALLHRVHPNIQLAVFEDLDHLWRANEDYWAGHMSNLGSHTLLSPSPGALGIGAGAPPIRTARGFLLFFHERDADGTYTMNLALLDRCSGEVLSALPYPILVPELDWELHGDVDNVVFVQGAHRSGDEIYLVYGAADRYVGAASASVDALLGALAAA